MRSATPDLASTDARVPPAGDAAGRRQWWFDACALALLAVAIRLPALLAPRSLVFDDGVFASSAFAMRDGGAPFRDVFSSQGPLFLPFVWVGDLLGGRTMSSPRVLSVTSGVIATVALYAIARHLTGRGAALVAAALVTTSGSVLWVTGPVNADGPAMAAALGAVALALRCRARPAGGDWWPVGVGVMAGIALSIKLLALPAVAVAGLVVLDVRHRRRDGFVAAATAGAVWLVSALPWGLERVWEQSFEYHRGAAREYGHLEAAWVVVRTLWDRDLVVVVVAALAAAGALLARRRGTPLHVSQPRVSQPHVSREARALAVWALLTFALLVWEPAVWRAHVAHLVPPLVLLAALRLPPARVVAVAVVLTAPVWALHNDGVLAPERYEGSEAAVVRSLSRLPEGSLAISDEPGWVWRAGLQTPDHLVDPSFLRIDAGQITATVLTRAAARPEVCAVVASSPRRFLRFPTLSRRLAVEGYRPRRVGGRIELYVKDACGAPGDQNDGAGPPAR